MPPPPLYPRIRIKGSVQDRAFAGVNAIKQTLGLFLLLFSNNNSNLRMVTCILRVEVKQQSQDENVPLQELQLFSNCFIWYTNIFPCLTVNPRI